MSDKKVEEKEKKLLPGAPFIMIVGEGGVGKTRTAGKLKGAYCLDTEPPGSASAFPPEYRHAFQSKSTIYEDLYSKVKTLTNKGELKDRHIHINDLKISALVIDTFDMLQQTVITRYLETNPKKQRPNWIGKDQIWAPSMEQQDWGTVLRYFKPLIHDLQDIGIPVIFVVHGKLSEPDYKGYGANKTLNRPGYWGTEISGSIEGYIRNLSDNVLYLLVDKNSNRVMYTDLCVVEDTKIPAKDRHEHFSHKAVKMELGEDGFPKKDILQFIIDQYDY